jgi:LEA14-like dessication related protein
MRRGIALLLSVFMLGACATMRPGFEEPTVTLTSFRALPAEGMSPAFEIGLRIINPNPDTLELRGIVYTVSLEGREVIKGVGKDFPPIEGYSQGDVVIVASAQLIEGLQLLADMMSTQRDTLDYAFDAKLDLGGLYPSIRVSEGGRLDLGQGSPR